MAQVIFYEEKDGKKVHVLPEDIDARLCEHFNVSQNENGFFAGWYDIVAMRLCMGWSYERISMMCKTNMKERPQFEKQYKANAIICQLFQEWYTYIVIG